MSRRRRRGILIAGALCVFAVAVGLVLVALRDSIVFFHTPSDLSAKAVPVSSRREASSAGPAPMSNSPSPIPPSR
jgi:cytochrome c-type biogenesis protein CcmE